MSEQISIYVHWPFCESKCPYCDFNSHVADHDDIDNWQKAYIEEIKQYRHIFFNKEVISIFFGGGTPSLMPASIITSIINTINLFGKITDKTEITLEANPGSVERGKFIDFKTAGINRISIGVQSFNNKNLTFLGRKHSSCDAIKAIELADQIFQNYSFDLIYSLPGQKTIDWEKELISAAKYIKYHISCYQLTIEKGTQFYQDFKTRKFSMPSLLASSDMYNITQSVLQNLDIEQYEISNYAAPNYRCLHNIIYWKMKGYIGIGPGAHGRYINNNQILYSVNFYKPEKWKNLLLQGHTVTQSKTIISCQEDRKEKIMMGLRLNEGIKSELIANKSALQQLITQGFLTKKEENITTTKKGRLVLNHILEILI